MTITQLRASNIAVHANAQVHSFEVEQYTIQLAVLHGIFE